MLLYTDAACKDAVPIKSYASGSKYIYKQPAGEKVCAVQHLRAAWGLSQDQGSDRKICVHVHRFIKWQSSSCLACNLISSDTPCALSSIDAWILQVEPLFVKLDNEAKNLEKLPTGIVVTMASKAIPFLGTESTGVIQLIPSMKVPGVGESQVHLRLMLTPSRPFCSLHQHC
jgi:hypothetical protein